MKKKIILCFSLALLMVFCMFPQAASADSKTYDLASVSSGMTLHLSSKAGDTFTLINSGSPRTRINIVCTDTIHLTLDGVSIDDSANSDLCPLTLAGTGSTLTLVGENTLIGGESTPAVNVAEGVSLTVDGAGKLTAIGGANAAGIGGGYMGAAGSISISGSANVLTTGGVNGAGLGSGQNAADSDTAASVFTMDGGTVQATGGDGACGIGGGAGSNGGTIRVTGGHITATGGDRGSGIGNGESAISGSATDIQISGGTVFAYGGTDSHHIGGAGLGSGYLASACSVNITGGSVTAKGGWGGAGIGAGYKSLVGTVMISAGTADATGGCMGPGIGGLGSSGSIAIKGGNVTATAGTDENGYGGAAGIGGAIGNSIDGDYTTPAITIDNGTITAAGSADFATGGGAGIGGGKDCHSSEITINGGSVKAAGSGLDAAGGSGIGSGSGGTTKTVVLSGGNVEATGYGSNPGIGGSPYDADTKVSLSNCTVFAAKGDFAAYDIGSATEGENILNIFGRARVFLRNDAYCSPVSAPAHTHRVSGAGFTGSSFLGIPVKWKGSFGAFLRPYTLSYDTNGGSGITPSPAEQNIDTSINVFGGGGLSKAYCTFAGWNTRPDGGGTDYASNSAFTFDKNTTLYAKWAPYTYTVVYAGNGGSGTMPPITHTYGVSRALDANAYTRKGYTFAGWATEPGGPADLFDGQSVLNLTSANGGVVTLYARWVPISYTVVYDKNGRTSGQTAPSAHTFDTVKALTANGFTKTGFTFMGWAKSPYGAVAYIDNESVANMTAENGATIRLYAVWSSSGKYFIKAVSNNAKYGKVSGGGVYNGGNSATLTAVPMDGYRFVKWTEGGKTVSSNAVYGFTAAKARSLTAYFEKIGKTRLSSAKATGKGGVKLSWKALSGAKGYYIYRATSKTGKYTKVKTITGALTCTDTGLKLRKGYYYKIKDYCVADKKTTYGGFSNMLFVKTK